MSSLQLVVLSICGISVLVMVAQAFYEGSPRDLVQGAILSMLVLIVLKLYFG